jgi:hypothetical protein
LSQALARHGLAMAHHLRNEPAEAAEIARENLEFAMGLNFPYWRGLAQMVLGTELARLGDPGGLAVLDEGLERLGSSGNLSGGSVGMALLADANLHAERFDDAIAAAELGLATGEMIDQPFCDTELLSLKGRALVALGRVDEGLEHLEQSLTTGLGQGAASATLQTVLALAPLVAPEDPLRSRRLLEDALVAMGDGADTVDQRSGRAQLADLVASA